MNDTELIHRVAHHEAGHAVVCFILCGEQVIKSVSVHSLDGVKGEITTYSRLPIPLVCRPPIGAPRRGNPAPVSADAIVDAHGVLSYAGMVAEQVLSESWTDGGEGGVVPRDPVRPDEHKRGMMDREALSKLASLIGAARPVEQFFEEYWQEARRLLRAHWPAVDALAEELIERGSLHGDRVDVILRGFC